MAAESRRQARRADLPPEERAKRLRESIYLVFAALSVSVAVRAHGQVDPAQAMTTLGVTLAGTVLAVFTSDVIAHLVTHERMISLVELGHTVYSTFGALSAVVLPFVFLTIAALTGWDADAALLASTIAMAASLVILAATAVRRVPLTWWQRVIALGTEGVLGLLVIGLQVVAHSYTRARLGTDQLAHGPSGRRRGASGRVVRNGGASEGPRAASRPQLPTWPRASLTVGQRRVPAAARPPAPRTRRSCDRGGQTCWSLSFRMGAARPR
ncbi:hypothetical protein [Intrasporangium sp.]|uniref:hypothetical protein n=1 Tax=Intrasporangium sp. TaxID=1925024 RepID=UPI003221D071